MKTKIFNLIMVTILFSIGLSNCSNDEFNPEDYVESILSGDYGKGGYRLDVTENGEPIEITGHVRFDSKDPSLKKGNFIFVDILPGESKKEFKDVPLDSTENIIDFSMEYNKNGGNIIITGSLEFGQMKIDISY